MHCYRHEETLTIVIGTLHCDQLIKGPHIKCIRPSVPVGFSSALP
jgi:hypothetical protein